MDNSKNEREKRGVREDNSEGMKTKEAIKKVTDKYEGWQGWARTQKEVDELGEERDKIIRLLERGEKYEQMWEWLEKIYIKEDNTFKLHNEWGYFCDIKEMTTDIKQKYFPEPE